MPPTSIRELLNGNDFDWENGVIVIPGEKGENIFLPPTSVALDRKFDLNDTSQNGAPIFTAEDPVAMYLMCNYPEVAVAVFRKVPVETLEGMNLGGIQGYPTGPGNRGIDLNFAKGPLEVFVTHGECYPAIAGCPEIHFYCIASDKKDVMDTFTLRMLVGYLTMKGKKNAEQESGVVKQRGYTKLLERLFYQKLGVEERELPPIEEGEA